MQFSRKYGFSLFFLILGIGLVVHSLYFNFICDDAYISFVYSRNFAETNALVFNAGTTNPVEGYTNFLWTLLLGLLMKVGVAPEISSRILGVIFGFGTLIATFHITRTIRGKPAIWDYIAPTLLVLSSGYACWTSGGLETHMFTFWVVLAIAFMLKERLKSAALLFVLGALTRPEGILVFAVAVLHRLVTNIISSRKILPDKNEIGAALVFVGLYGLYVAWRWKYYGYPFPNTFYAKAGAPPSPAFAEKMLNNGLFYAWQWAIESCALYVAPLALVALWCHRRAGSLFILLTGIYLAYTIKIGGDFMGLHRFIMPLFVFTAIMAALGLESTCRLLPRKGPILIGTVASILLVGSFAWSQVLLSRRAMEPWHRPGRVPGAIHGIDTPGYLKLYTHDRALVGKALAPHIQKDDFSIVGGVGVQPYYAKLKAVDIFGLVSEEIAHRLKPVIPRAGHSKYAPGNLLLRWYDPTFLFSCYAIHRDPWRYKLCPAMRYFLNNGYEPITLHVPGMREMGEYYTFLKKKTRRWR